MNFSFLIPTLAQNELSPNGAHGNPHAVNKARQELRKASFVAVRSLWATPPRFERAMVRITYRIAPKRPGDGYYRPRDVANIGGNPVKPVIDGLVDAGVLLDDNREHLTELTLRIESVEELVDEGIFVEVEGG